MPENGAAGQGKQDGEMPILRSEQRGNVGRIIPFSYKKGQSGNPGGRPKIAQFRRAVEAVVLAKVDIGEGKKAPRLRILLEAAYEKALIQLKHSPTGVQDVISFLTLLRDTIDGKPTEQTVSATKEQRIYIVGGEVTKTEEVQTESGTVKIG